MAFDSFRDFVSALDSAGELIRVQQPVATELEITEIADREMKKPGGGKALLFEQPAINGNVSPFPLAINTMGSDVRMAMSLRAKSVESVATELGALMKAKPPTGFREAIKLLGTALDLRHAKPSFAKTGPCKQVIHRFDGARANSSSALPTLLNLPIQKCWPQDGGTFHHPPLRCHQRSRHRRAQRRHVSHADLRFADHRHALAIAEGRRAPRPPLL